MATQKATSRASSIPTTVIYSQLADSGAIARVTREYSAATAPDLSHILRLPNLPPHQLVSVERGAKTTVNVYADKADEQNWAVILESLGP